MLFLASNDHSAPNPDKAPWNSPEASKAYYRAIMGNSDKSLVLELVEEKETPFSYSQKVGDVDVERLYMSMEYMCDPAILDGLTCVIVHGGNTFHISQLLHRNGWFDFIKHKVNDKKINYVGYSAGAIMATPNIMTAMWADNITKEFTSDIAYLQGFNFVNFCIKPHFDHYVNLYYEKQFVTFEKMFSTVVCPIYELGAIVVDDDGETKVL